MKCLWESAKSRNKASMQARSSTGNLEVREQKHFLSKSQFVVLISGVGVSSAR